MDKQLLDLLGPDAASTRPGETRSLTKFVHFPGEVSPQIEVGGHEEGFHPYTLKTLPELYGPGTGASSIDPRDEQFRPLLMAIEGEICRYADTEAPGLTDGQVLLAVKDLAMNPDADPSDPLARRIAIALRLAVSLNDYSRQDVRGALRQVAKSVERHTKSEGRRGYLQFIRQFFAKARK
jgi:hypothetical protein